MTRMLSSLALLGAFLIAGPARSAESPAVELCVQRPEGGGRTLGHLRLVVDQVFYERRTPDDEISGQPTAEREDAVRNRKSRTLLHVMPPMLRFPLSRRPVWGVTVRDRVPDRTVHPDGSEYWPFECVPIPASPDQRQALRALGDASLPAVIGDGRTLAFDHSFDYVHDNCTTWICLLLADGLMAAPGGGEGEAELVELLRRERRPLRLLRRLHAWQTRHAPSPGEGG